MQRPTSRNGSANPPGEPDIERVRKAAVATLVVVAAIAVVQAVIIAIHLVAGGRLSAATFLFDRATVFAGSLAVLGFCAYAYLRVIAPAVRSGYEVRESRRAMALALERSEERFRSIFEHHRDAAAAFGPDRTLIRVNAAATKLLGYREDEMLGKTGLELLDEEQRARSRAYMDRVYAGETCEWTSNARCKNGTRIETSIFGMPAIVGGQVVGAFTFVRDVTEQRRLEARLAGNEARIRSLTEIASSDEPDANRLIDRALALGAAGLGVPHAYLARVENGSIVVRNHFGEIGEFQTGFSMPMERALVRHVYGTRRALAEPDLTIEPWATEVAERRLPWHSFMGATVFVDDAPYGTLTFSSTDVRDRPFEETDLDFVDLVASLIGSVLARERRQDELRGLAFYDVLTGLANRALLEEHLETAIAKARRDGERVALHFVDLDRFKPINDAYGHAAGDEVLRQVARRFTAASRAHDVVARVGGDEFVVLQAGVADESVARALAARLRDSLRAPFSLPGGAVVDVGASFGLAIYPQQANDARGLLHRADAAMYEAKRAAGALGA